MMRNLNLSRLCNSMQLIIEELHENLIVAKIITSALKDQSFSSKNRINVIRKQW